MLDLIPSETVTVLRPAVDRDDLGEPVGGAVAAEDVPAVVAPGPASELDASRPSGTVVAYTLHLPKSYRGPLRGCSVRVRGRLHHVVGDPQPYTEPMLPGPWGLPVEVEAVDG